MTTKRVESNGVSRLLAWAVAGLFAVGFFYSPVGVWTGPVLAVWFVGTQKPWRGLAWMVALNYVPGLVMDWRRIPLTSPQDVLHFLGLGLLLSVLGILPFTFHRLTSPRLNGLVSTLPFPAGAVVMHNLIEPQLHLGATFGIGVSRFLPLWFAAVVVWMWNEEFRAAKIAKGAGVFALIFGLVGGLVVWQRLGGAWAPAILQKGTAFGWICAGAAALLSLRAVFSGWKPTSWTQRPETVALLRSPQRAEALDAVVEGGREVLVSSSGERFPVRDGVPDFRGPGDLTGDNGKYNQLYETIGGFYDDTQRVACALKGLNRDEYFLAYMRKLEVKAGDRVLETSVGTGLNLKYLPKGVRIAGLDLSAEMLASCRANLRRWGLEADLYLGNAERLPFADASFDVVFHVGGISFFNDQGKAIREMIRVARPGSLLLISDETEEYAQKTYERIPITSSYYKNRKKAVTIPVDLVPGEMEEVQVEMIKGGLFYALTFRKPGRG